MDPNDPEFNATQTTEPGKFYNIDTALADLERFGREGKKPFVILFSEKGHDATLVVDPTRVDSSLLKYLKREGLVLELASPVVGMGYFGSKDNLPKDLKNPTQTFLVDGSKLELFLALNGSVPDLKNQLIDLDRRFYMRHHLDVEH